MRQALFNLRKAIGDHAAYPPYLLITRDEIQFNPASDYALDLSEFDVQLAACESHARPRLETCAVCAPRLQKAVDLYRGKFLQEFFLEDSAEFEEWALARREATHQRALDALTRLADYYELHGDLAETRRCAVHQLELDPWREQAHRQMMRVLMLEGQRRAALAQYETCRRMLAEELGVEDLGIRYGGSYYLTYHKFATREQVLKCSPQFPEFLRQKKQYDPKEVFQSDWYRFYKKMFSDVV